jgi:hypothetical protein
VDTAPGPRARPAVMIVTAIMMALSVITLQRCFDDSDRRKALQLVWATPISGGTLQQALVALADGGEASCNPPEIVSSCAGTLIVECFAGAGNSYRFSADLVRRAVTPANENARRLLSQAADGGDSATDGAR